MQQLIKINPLATKIEDYAAIAPDARIRIQARKRIGTRDDDGTAIIQSWWVETELLAYLPAWDLESVHKGRDYAVIVPQDEFYPSWWYRPWSWKTEKLTRARSCFDIHPEDYLLLKPVCQKLQEKLGKSFLISRHGLAWGWEDFRI